MPPVRTSTIASARVSRWINADHVVQLICKHPNHLQAPDRRRRARGRIIRKARTQRDQSPEESHATRRTPGWRWLQTDQPQRGSQSPEAVRLDRAGADEFSVACRSLPQTDPYAHGKVSPAMTREAS